MDERFFIAFKPLSRVKYVLLFSLILHFYGGR